MADSVSPPPGAVPVPTAPAAKTATTAVPAQPLEDGGIKETIESILVAFILAFIFRAFVVEAFVIPTGSMAPTLLGAHMRFHCDDCAYPFDVNFSGRTVGDEVDIPSVARGKTYALFCPNCGLKVPKDNPREPENDATDPPVHYGDRILVLKYAYLLSDPQRWDVVVFKSPDPQPGVPLYVTNYIKRLIGRPGESVFILDGDIYVGTRETAKSEFRVQTKPRAAQESLWRIVYDNDFLPTRPDWQSPWAPLPSGSGWLVIDPTTGKPMRTLHFNNTEGGGWLRFDPTLAREKQALSDWLAYAVTRSPTSGESYDHGGLIGRNNVSDLKLDVYYKRESGDGPLRLQLTKLGETFTAEVLPGKVRLLQRGSASAGDLEIASAPLTLSPTATMRVELANVDYRVTLRINGRDYLQTTLEQYRPDVARLLAEHRRGQVLPKPDAKIGAERQVCSLSHVSLWRDVYYTNYDPDSPGRIHWGTPEYPIELGEKEYWVLGDNSLMSGDGRYWSIPVELPDEGLYARAGVVPERFLLGKAFFVYWPAGYRPQARLPGMVPNFGDMRFIH
jgi:signal peptidase I